MDGKQDFNDNKKDSNSEMALKNNPNPKQGKKRKTVYKQ